MAVVKILWNRNVVALEQYLFEGRLVDDPLELSGCTDGYVSEEFIGNQVFFGESQGLSAIHLIQSFDEADSSKLAPEEYAKLGRELVEKQFPGHQFCVVTHSSTGRLHNHIMVNPVSEVDGKRIHNKMRLLYALRERSDELCKERGLSIVDAQSQERWKETPVHVQEIKRRGGFSWVLDLKEKADFARSIATSYDEYAGVLNQFGIQVRVEDKNVVYLYPDRKAKRGDTRGLGHKYSKDGLKEQFQENYIRFFEAGLKQSDPSEVNFSDHWKFHRKDGEYFVPPYRYKDLVIPPSLIASVQGIDLGSVITESGLKLVPLNDGRSAIKGREHVTIEDGFWCNDRNRVKGRGLELQAYLKDTSWLGVLKDFDSTGRVQRVFKIQGEVKPTFQAFYAPKVNRDGHSPVEVSPLSELSTAIRATAPLLKKDQVKFIRGGAIKFRAQGNLKSSITAHRIDEGWVCRSSKGVPLPFIKRVVDPKRPLVVFENPIAFLSNNRFFNNLERNRSGLNLVVPLKPLDEFLKEGQRDFKKFPKVFVVRSELQFGWGEGARNTRPVQRSESREVNGLLVSYVSIDELLKELILGRDVTREV